MLLIKPSFYDFSVCQYFVVKFDRPGTILYLCTQQFFLAGALLSGPSTHHGFKLESGFVFVRLEINIKVRHTITI